MKIPAIIVLLACSLAIVSCGEKGPSSRQGILTVLCWTDYIPESAIIRFEKEHGVIVDMINYENTDEACGRLISSPQNYDVAVLDDATFKQLEPRRLLLELDQSKLPNRVNLGKFAGLSFDPENTYCMPYLWGCTLVAYDKEKITPKAKSWNLLWDAEVLGEHEVFMTDEPQELFAVSLYSLNKPMNSTRPEDIAAAEAKLLAQVADCHPVYITPTGMYDALREKQCLAAMAYNTVALCAQKENPALEIFIPEEGAPLWFDLFTISRESPQADLAHKFINYMMEAEVAAECAEYNSCATANQAAEAKLPPEMLANPILYPDDRMLAKCGFHDNTNPERLQLIAMHMQKLKEGIQKQKPGVATAK